MSRLGQGRRGGGGGGGCGCGWVLGGGADAAAAELIEITWTTGTTQSVPTASPAPFSVARLVRRPEPVLGIDIVVPHLSS